MFLNLEEYSPVENSRPDWLITEEGERLELDFYVERLDLAIEVQGKQHYTYIPYFHQEYSGFLTGLRRDRFKREKCEQRGVRLYETASTNDVDLSFLSILDLVSKKLHPDTCQQVLIARDDLPASEFEAVQAKGHKLPMPHNCNIAQLRILIKATDDYITGINTRISQVLNWENGARQEACKKHRELQRFFGSSSKTKRDSAKKGARRVSKRIQFFDNEEMRVEMLSKYQAEVRTHTMYIAVLEDLLVKRSCLSVKKLQSSGTDYA